MTGRTLHDALLRVLTSGRLRALATAGDVAGLAVEVGAAEARTLCEADPARLDALARFLGRHFYRERIVRLFAACRRLASDAGQDPLVVLDGEAFRTFLARAEVGSTGAAHAVAALVEEVVRPVLGVRPWGPALALYEGTLFRTEAGPRQWTPAPEAAAVARAPSARLLTLDWDVTGLVAAVRRGESVLPDPRPGPTPLLVALAPDGRVTTVRASAAIERLLGALDVAQPPSALAARLGVEEAALRRLLEQLADVGAIHWTDGGRAGGAPRPG